MVDWTKDPMFHMRKTMPATRRMLKIAARRFQDFILV
jgi:hypothetical protein